MPAPIRLQPPYDLHGAIDYPGAGTPHTFTLQNRHADRKTGGLWLSSTLLVWDASDAESAGVVHNAYCTMFVAPNGKPPITITATYLPATTAWAGAVLDETGSSAVDLRWSFMPAAWIDIQDGKGAVRMTPKAPTHFFQRSMTDASTHGWGPVTWPKAGARYAEWTYNGPMPPHPDSPDIILDIGIESAHSVTADDAGVTSHATAAFTLALVNVQMS